MEQELFIKKRCVDVILYDLVSLLSDFWHLLRRLGIAMEINVVFALKRQIELTVFSCLFSSLFLANIFLPGAEY